jgi:phage shock protein A
MALITRVSRLFRADLHAVLDRIEEPEILLRQAVREMEEDLDRDQQRLRLLVHEQQQLTSRFHQIHGELDRTETELDVCFDSGKEDLARSLVRRRLEAQQLRSYLEQRQASLERSLAQLRSRVQENRSRLEAMRQKAELLAEEESTVKTEPPWEKGADRVVRDEDVEVAFLAEKQRRSRS